MLTNVILFLGHIFAAMTSSNDVCRGRSEHDPRMKPSVRNPPRKRGYLSRSPRALCSWKNNSRSGFHSKFHQILRLPQNVTIQHRQILPLRRKITIMIDPRHIRNVIYNARSNRSYPPTPTSPNIAPATKKTFISDPRHMWNAIYNARSNRGYPPTSPNIAPATNNDSPKFERNLLKTAETSFTMRGRSEHDPRMKQLVRNPPRKRGYLSRSPRAFCSEKNNLALRLSFQISPSDAAPAAKSDSWTSPNTAPATKSDTWTSSNKCTCQEKRHLNFTK